VLRAMHGPDRLAITSSLLWQFLPVNRARRLMQVIPGVGLMSRPGRSPNVRFRLLAASCRLAAVCRLLTLSAVYCILSTVRRLH